ncbi:MAG: hypothetical protein ACTHMR_14015 [Thermomicrobiales bacterium]
MRWGLLPAPRLLGADEELTTSDDAAVFPAGVVALGRGGAGETGALLRPDGVYVGLLLLDSRSSCGGPEIAQLAAALPTSACQVLTVRRPVDLERQTAAWEHVTRGQRTQAGLAAAIADGYLPELVAAGWSETSTVLALLQPSADRLRRELTTLATAWPGGARIATPHEVKALAGDWLAGHEAGLVTIGWDVTELTAEPDAAWVNAILDHEALAGAPVMIAIHLAPAGSPAPVSLEARRRLAALDETLAAIAPGDDDEQYLLAERRELLAVFAAATSQADSRPRPARLLIACTIEPRYARAVRSAVEPELWRLGFVTTSFGPGRGHDLLLSCAPLGQPLVGRGMTLTTRGAVQLLPLLQDRMLPTARAGAALPLGLQPDGGAVWIRPGESLVLTGPAGSGKTAVAQTWTLGQLASGKTVSVLDTSGAWHGIAIAGAGAAIPAARHAGALLATLALEPVDGLSALALRERAEAWVALATALLEDCCPALGADARGDLTAQLLGLAEDALHTGRRLGFDRVVKLLRAGGETAAAGELAALLKAGSGTAPDLAARLIVLDAADGGERELPVAAVRAISLATLLARLRAASAPVALPQIIVLDALDDLLDCAAGPLLASMLVRAAAATGVAVWCVCRQAPAAGGSLTAALREARCTLVAQASEPGEQAALAQALGFSPALVAARVPRPGAALLLRPPAPVPGLVVQPGQTNSAPPRITALSLHPWALPPFAQSRVESKE